MSNCKKCHRIVYARRILEFTSISLLSYKDYFGTFPFFPATKLKILSLTQPWYYLRHQFTRGGVDMEYHCIEVMSLQR